MSKQFLCIFCAHRESTASHLKLHIWSQHLKTGFDKKFDLLVDYLSDYCQYLTQTIGNRSARQRLPEYNVNNLLIGCSLCDQIIDCYGLQSFDRQLKPKRNECVCGRTGVSKGLTSVVCNRCQHCYHLECFQDFQTNGQDLTQYLCRFCKTRDFVIESANDLKPLDQLRHFRQHIDYRPFKCCCDALCDKRFYFFPLLIEHIKNVHKISENTLKNSEKSFYSYEKILEIEEILEKKGIKSELFALGFSADNSKQTENNPKNSSETSYGSIVANATTSAVRRLITTANTPIPLPPIPNPSASNSLSANRMASHSIGTNTTTNVNPTISTNSAVNPVASTSSTTRPSAQINSQITPAVQLPDGLSQDLLSIIDKIKKLSYVSQWLTDEKTFNFFKQRLIELEKKCSKTSKLNRKQVYKYLSSYLPFTLSELQTKAKNAVTEGIEVELKKEISSVKAIVNQLIPPHVYSLHNRADSDIKGVKHKFHINNQLMRHLHKAIGYKTKIFNRLDNMSPNLLSSYLNSFIVTELIPIWPKGWMSAGVLLNKVKQYTRRSGQSAQPKSQSVPTPVATVSASNNTSNEEIIDISDDSSADEQEGSRDVSSTEPNAETFSNNTQIGSTPPNTTEKKNHFKRLCIRLGHISCVYCIAFDRTGKYVFTASDDYLIKIWSALDGRLISTLRGHQFEVTDIAVDYENTLLASGDINYLIFIWCLKSAKTLTTLKCHTKQITSLEFAPMPTAFKYLVSTGDDGRVCFWKYNNITKHFKSTPEPQIREQHSKRSGISCSSISSGGHLLAIGSTDSYVTIYRMNTEEEPKKIFEKKMHWGHVDRLHFSHNSLHFVSSSNNVWNERDVDKDNAFIWKFDSTVSTWDAIPIKVYKQKSGKYSYKKLILEMAWTCDDLQIITSLSDHSIKIWNSSDGELLHVFEAHTDEVHVIQSHPILPHIFLSAGYDSKIILWNITKERTIKTFNSLKGRAILDAGFSPNGLMFGATDAYGRLSLFGVGAEEPYKSLPDQMFFHTDYHLLVETQDKKFVDEETKVKPHLLPIPFLVDINGYRYPPKVQRLVPGREHCLDYQNEPYVCVSDQTNKFVLEPVFKPTILSSTPNKTITDNSVKVNELIEILTNHMTRSQLFDILFINYIKQLIKRSNGEKFKKFFEILVKVVTSKLTYPDFHQQLNDLIVSPPLDLYLPILTKCLPFFKPKSDKEIFSELVSQKTKLRILNGLHINTDSGQMSLQNESNPSALSVDAYALKMVTPKEVIEDNYGQSSNRSKEEVMECIKYISVTLMLASIQPTEVMTKIQTLIQKLINDTIDAKTYVNVIEKDYEISFAKEDYPLFLKRTLPQLRYLMSKNIVAIDSITAPQLWPPKKLLFVPKATSEHSYFNPRYEESADKRTLFLRDKEQQKGPYNEKGWKVAKKQLLRRPGNWVSYDFDLTWNELWKEREAVMRLTDQQLNLIYSKIKEKEIKEKNILLKTTQAIQTDGSESNANPTIQTQTNSATVSTTPTPVLKSILSVKTPSQSRRSMAETPEPQNPSEPKRKRLRFSSVDTNQTNETEIINNENRAENSSSSATMTGHTSDEDTDMDDNRNDSDSDTDIEIIKNTESTQSNRRDVTVIQSTVTNAVLNEDQRESNETERELRPKSTPNVLTASVDSRIQPILETYKQNIRNAIVREMESKKPKVEVVSTQTTFGDFQHEIHTQTDPQMEIKPEIKSEFTDPSAAVKHELCSETEKHYLCIFCRKSKHFMDRKEAFDHYRRHLALVIRCDICFANFVNVRAFHIHNSDHSNSDRNISNVKNYCLSLDWIDSFLDFQMSDQFIKLSRNANEYCPICAALKADWSTSVARLKSCDYKVNTVSEIGEPFGEHIRKHLNCDQVFECIECQKFGLNKQKLKFCFGLTELHKHLDNSHDLKHLIANDNNSNQYFISIDKLSPNLEEFINKCKEICNCINDLYETNSIE